MNEEITKVLTMIQDGKIDADQGSELIQVLKEKEETSNKPKYLDKTLKIRVVSTENDNVMVNLPIKLVKAVLMAGHSIAASIPQSEKYVKDIDINLLIEAIENELDGQIVDIKSANGDTVSVIIE
ncbi:MULTISPECIES: SHOCT-like domain-containing protein [Lysinibacillus]|uniref:YvlB/LiaX N-terminal domain-containing protein n=1 Tax=Lysinibacillus xylanilyticus TaxID=582475 RepID=A0ABV3VQY2_9BACI